MHTHAVPRNPIKDLKKDKYCHKYISFIWLDLSDLIWFKLFRHSFSKWKNQTWWKMCIAWTLSSRRILVGCVDKRRGKRKNCKYRVMYTRKDRRDSGAWIKSVYPNWTWWAFYFEARISGGWFKEWGRG